MAYSRKQHAWLIWSIPATFYALGFILRISPGILMHEIISHYKISHLQFALLPSLFYFGYAILQIPAGLALDHFKPNKVLAIFMFVTAIGILLFSQANSFILGALGFFIIGIGTIIGILGASAIIAIKFRSKTYGLLIGLTLTLALVTASYAGKIVHIFIRYFSWQQFYNLTAILCIIYAILALSFAKVGQNARPQKTDVSVSGSLLLILKNPYLILLSIFAGFMTASVQGFADVWGPTFLHKNLGLSLHNALLANSLCFVGFAIGAPIIGKVAQKYNILKQSVIACGLLMAVSLSLILVLPDIHTTITDKLLLWIGIKPTTHNLIAVLIGKLMFLTGIGSAFPGLIFTLVIKKVNKEHGNLAIGLVNMIMTLFGSVYNPLIGYLYTINPFLAISVVPGGIIIGTIGMTILFYRFRK